MQLPFKTTSLYGLFNIIGVACILLGALLRINHTGGADILLLTGAIIFGLGQLVPHFQKKQKQWVDYLLLIGTVCLVLFILSRTVLREQLMEYQLYFGFGVLLAAPFYMIRQLKSDMSLKRVLYFAGLTGIAVGVLFKTKHWPGATVLLLFGLLLAVLSYILDLFSSPKENPEDANVHEEEA